MRLPPTARRSCLLAGAASVFFACHSDRLTNPSPAGPPAPLDRGAPPASPIIASENANAGTPNWFTAPADRAVSGDLALWASPYNPLPGDSLDVFVHARYGPVTLSLYRLGWYGATGGRLMFEQGAVAANPQPSCTSPSPGPVYCPWSRTGRLSIDASWNGGIYLLKATDTRGKSWAYPFVVTDRRKSAITALIPQFTWQAYNGFGGGSLYLRDSTTGLLGHTVSFERPYAGRGGGTYVYGNGYSNDLAAVHWLERNGYDVSYASDADLAGVEMRAPVPYRILMMVGHSEYWTWNVYSFVQLLRDRGVHLMFLSANNAYWNVRMSEGIVTGRPRHIMVCYKNQPDVQAATIEETTGLFRAPPLNRPENALYGVMHFVHGYGSFPLIVSDSAQGALSAAFLGAASLHPTDTLSNILSLPSGAQEMSSIEGDRISNNGHEPRGVQVLFRSEIVATDGSRDVFHTTFFVAPSGSGVFASGFNEWGRWLDDWFAASDPRIISVTKAMVDWMLVH